MTKLDNLLEQFDELDKKTFNYNRDYKEVIRQLSELSFVGEIDHNNFYLTLLEQIFVTDKEGMHLITLNDDQREQFYTKGYISSYETFKIANSLHIFINSEKNYVQVFLQKGFLQKFSSPKDDYGLLYEKSLKNGNKSASFDDSQSIEKAEFVVSNLDSDDPGKEVYEKLIKVLRLSKTNAIDTSNFDLKVNQNMSKYWGNLNHNKDLIEDEYQETERPEIIKIPHSHKKFVVSADQEIMSILEHAGFDEIDYDNGLTRTYDTLRDAEAVFYSVIDYINTAALAPVVHPTASPQKIVSVEKHYLSNKWPTAADDAEYEKQKKELTKYTFSMTKFHDTNIVKLEVWEMGSVYIITNVWDRRSIN